jgi:hypothetical protein
VKPILLIASVSLSSVTVTVGVGLRLEVGGVEDMVGLFWRFVVIKEVSNVGFYPSLMFKFKFRRPACSSLVSAH